MNESRKKLRSYLPRIVRPTDLSYIKYLLRTKLDKSFLKEFLLSSGVIQKWLRVVNQRDSIGHTLSNELDSFLFLTQKLQAEKTDKAGEKSKEVSTSIIIPVFNQAEYTFQCLLSLLKCIDLNSNEIIVVNNASNDATKLLLSYFGELIRNVDNTENKGFVDACNQGASVARGKYLVFLNNDTVPQPGWLENLLQVIETDESVGAVGSMLIYPDGRLQEAGGIIWNDAAGNNYGRLQKTDDYRFNYLREVDYCSGASLLVRKNLFEQLGMFDKRYAPAYYEDTDLCFGVRSLGYKVVYQPLSKIIHFEGVTAGISTQSGFKRFQEINRTKFLEKWHEVLQREHLPPDTDAIHGANRLNQRRFIVFDHKVPTPDQDSGSLRMFSILQLLTKIGGVVFVPESHKNDFSYVQKLGQIGVEVVPFHNSLKRLSQENFEAAILSRPEVAALVLGMVRKCKPQVKIIYDTVDLHFVRFQREFELKQNVFFAKQANLYQKIETSIAEKSDQIWCVTENDKSSLKAVVPRKRIQIIPNIHTSNGRGKTFLERNGLMFIGGYEHSPNVDAILYFLDEIFPLLLKEMPNLQFNIVGSKTPPQIFERSSANVIVRGFVPDIKPLFDECRVFVAPLRYGAGMKGKVGQALAFGLPTVTTSIGAEGMNMEHRKQVLIADTALDFAGMVSQIYRERQLWERISENGYSFIKENYSPAVVEKIILNALDKAVSQKS